MVCARYWLYDQCMTIRAEGVANRNLVNEGGQDCVRKSYEALFLMLRSSWPRKAFVMKKEAARMKSPDGPVSAGSERSVLFLADEVNSCQRVDDLKDPGTKTVAS